MNGSNFLTFSFANFQLEDEPHCEYDYVEIYDGYDDSSPKRGRFCGDKVIGVHKLYLLLYILILVVQSVPT